MRSARIIALFAMLPVTVFARTESALLIARGDSLDQELKTAEALGVYLEAEELDPDNPVLLVKIAKQYGESMVDLPGEAARRDAGRKALEYSLKAARLDPNFADAHLAAAICFGRLLSLVPARTRVEYSRLVRTRAEKAIALDPDSDYAWHILGRWHREVATTGAFLKGIVRLVYGGLPKAGLDEAISAFEKAAALDPDRVSHQIELGITYAEAGETGKARTAIEKGLSLPNRERDDPETKARGRSVLKELDT